MHEIQYIKRVDLDVQKWDACIDKAPNGLIYAYSFYLDAMCDNWDALVQGDYEAVMPLPWRKKWGLKYVYQPAFIQRLGIFGLCNEESLFRFYQYAKKVFSYIHYNVSDRATISEIESWERKNFIVNLSKGYDEIYGGYSLECQKNIRKAKARGCIFTTDVAIEQVVQNFRTTYGHLHKRQTDADYFKLTTFAESCLKFKTAIIGGVKDENEKLVYTALLLKDNKRIYYLLGAPTPTGRTKRATYFFIDAIINRYATQELIFDFEGSDLPNVAAFYNKFTSNFETYYEIKINTLPFYLSWLKK